MERESAGPVKVRREEKRREEKRREKSTASLGKGFLNPGLEVWFFHSRDSVVKSTMFPTAEPRDLSPLPLIRADAREAIRISSASQDGRSYNLSVRTIRIYFVKKTCPHLKRTRCLRGLGIRCL